MSAVSLSPIQISLHNDFEDFSSATESKTVKAAKRAFANLARQLSSLPSLKLLPYANELIEVSTPTKSASSQMHRTELLNPLEERERIEQPSMSAVLRLCFLSTFDEENTLDKVPFTEQDLAAFLLSKQTRERTYRWFYAGMAPFTFLSALQGFAALMWPTSPFGQAALITAAGTSVAALGILFTGYNPDISQDCLNEKVDKLNRVKRELDEVARSLISFCFYKRAPVRKLAQIGADEINLKWIEQAAIRSQKYGIKKQDMDSALELLSQAIAYIRDAKAPVNPDLNALLSSCLKRMEELQKAGEWENSIQD